MGVPKYSEEELIGFLHKFYNENNRVPSGADFANTRPSRSAYEYRFGSWNNAIEKAGLMDRKDNVEIKIKEQLIQKIKDFVKEFGYLPSTYNLSQHKGYPSAIKYKKVFGSMKNAIKEAGLDHLITDKNFSHKPKYTRDDLINIIIEFNNKNNRIPLSEDFAKMSPSTSTFYRHFKNWTDVLHASGLDRNQKNKEYTKDELLQFLIKYYNENKKVPTVKDIEIDKNMPSIVPYFSKFGSYKNALIESGLFDYRRDKHNFDRDNAANEEECLKLLKKYIIINDKIPTSDEIDSDKNMPSSMRYYNLFGGINNALKKIGCEPQNVRYRTDEEMINGLKDLTVELGRVPTSIDFDKCSYCSSGQIYTDRFGSIYNAFELAGIEYVKSAKSYSNEELTVLWKNLKENLNRIPTMRDIQFSEFDFSSAIIYRWGSYTKFLKELGEKINYNKYSCRIYLTDNGTLCLSYYEYRITKFLEEHGVIFTKEFLYRNIVPSETSLKRFDWVILHNNKTYYVEMFGLEGDEEYKKKTADKIKICQENNIPLIAIYPKDMKNKSLLEIFSFLDLDNKHKAS